jgi:hypothetical protein
VGAQTITEINPKVNTDIPFAEAPEMIRASVCTWFRPTSGEKRVGKLLQKSILMNTFLASSLPRPLLAKMRNTVKALQSRFQNEGDAVDKEI